MFLDRYYAFATSKTHGRFILGFDGVRAAGGATIDGDSFSTGGIDSVLEFTLPVFRAVVEYAVGPSAEAEYEHVLSIVRMIIEELGEEISAIKSADPDKYG